MRRYRAFLGLLLLSFPFLPSCGKDNPSSQIEINQISDRPVVIESNFTVDPTPADSSSGDEINIVGPWFPVRFAGSNPTERDLTIASFAVTVTSRDGSSLVWTPNLQNAQVILVAPAGTDFEMEQTAFVDGIPESDSSIYQVSMEFQGWFNTTIDDPNTEIDESTQPAESFKRVVQFNTQ